MLNIFLIQLLLIVYCDKNKENNDKENAGVTIGTINNPSAEQNFNSSRLEGKIDKFGIEGKIIDASSDNEKPNPLKDGGTQDVSIKLDIKKEEDIELKELKEHIISLLKKIVSDSHDTKHDNSSSAEGNTKENNSSVNNEEKSNNENSVSTNKVNNDKQEFNDNIKKKNSNNSNNGNVTKNNDNQSTERTNNTEVSDNKKENNEKIQNTGDLKKESILKENKNGINLNKNGPDIPKEFENSEEFKSIKGGIQILNAIVTNLGLIRTKLKSNPHLGKVKGILAYKTKNNEYFDYWGRIYFNKIGDNYIDSSGYFEAIPCDSMEDIVKYGKLTPNGFFQSKSLTNDELKEQFITIKLILEEIAREKKINIKDLLKSDCDISIVDRLIFAQTYKEKDYESLFK
ncbi:hypothetical protein TCON_1862 [Astathelohania contejeani]|uniref:Uncharacterized protein n=1 Tax=Astathelohania contejeani TaxID=164912 RepID=A0ABQ7HXP0_9MICR|nr:hypothetical protein TCON_1862 [Thelohania contejeani]